MPKMQEGPLGMDLPTMPEPAHRQLRLQFAGGFAVVLGLTCAFVAVTLASVSFQPEFPPAARWLFIVLICCESVLAAGLFLAVQVCDPGVIHRSVEVCTDMPQEVMERLRLSRPFFDDLDNIVMGDRSFCVRCLVWRSKGSKAHHCRVCQRCVVNFDHHCQVLGRCIAGKTPWMKGVGGHALRYSGNMLYFEGLICIGCLGWFTCSAAAVTAVMYISDHDLRTSILCVFCALFLCACCFRQPWYLVRRSVRCCVRRVGLCG